MPALKLLSATMGLRGRFGLCFHRAAAFVLDVPGAVLVMGTFRESDTGAPGESPVPFIHAWAEYRGLAYAPTTIERTGGKLVAMNRDGYYAVNEARDIYKLTRAQLIRLDRKHEIKRALRRTGRLKPAGAGFATTLLDAAGVPYKCCPDGGILPADKEGVE